MSSREQKISSGTVIIFVFDTDTKETDILRENLGILSKGSRFNTVWCVMQVPNLEGELVRATSIHDIKKLLGSRSLKDFKEDFIKEKNLYRKLCEREFSLDAMCEAKPREKYDGIENDGGRIKL